MLTATNNSDYSPGFGTMKISKNRRTVAALRKCTPETLNNIDQAGQTLANDNFLTGVIKKWVKC